MDNFSSRIEARLEPLAADTVRLVFDDVHPDGRRILFTQVDIPRGDMANGTFSRELATLVGENLLIRLAALASRS